MWISHCDKFQEARVNEWEHDSHASDSSVQESKYRWKDSSSWSWSHGLSDRDLRPSDS